MDVTTLNHGIISLFIPIAWVIILYPFYTKYRFHMTWVIILAAALSLVAMILKEFYDVDASINDIIADILGIFFGTGLAVGVLHVGERYFGKGDQPESSGRIHPESADNEAANPPDHLNLNDALCVGVIMTELGCLFYSESIENIENVQIQRLFTRLLHEKNDVVKNLKRYKKRMRDGTIHRSTIDDIRTAVGEYPQVENQGDFSAFLKRVFTVEKNLSSQYVKMEHDLPYRTGWKATPLKNLILSQQQCVGLLSSLSEGSEQGNNATGDKPEP